MNICVVLLPIYFDLHIIRIKYCLLYVTRYIQITPNYLTLFKPAINIPHNIVCDDSTQFRIDKFNSKH